MPPASGFDQVDPGSRGQNAPGRGERSPSRLVLGLTEKERRGGRGKPAINQGPGKDIRPERGMAKSRPRGPPRRRPPSFCRRSLNGEGGRACRRAAHHREGGARLPDSICRCCLDALRVHLMQIPSSFFERHRLQTPLYSWLLRVRFRPYQPCLTCWRNFSTGTDSTASPSPYGGDIGIIPRLGHRPQAQEDCFGHSHLAYRPPLRGRKRIEYSVLLFA